MSQQRPSQLARCQVGISLYQEPEAWIRQCINSARHQTLADELLITVRTDGPDACDRNTMNWLRGLANQDSRIQLIEGAQRLGSYDSYRSIFDQSQTPFLCQLDADDWLDQHALTDCLELLVRHPEAPFVYSDCQEVSADGAIQQLGQRSLRPFNHQAMLVQFITFHLRVIRRTAYNLCDIQKRGLRYTFDYDISLRLCELGTPIHLPKAIYYYRLHPHSMSKSKRQQTILEAFQVAQDALTRRRQQHLYQLSLDAEASGVSLRLRNGPVLIAGMHHSGTSLPALMLQKLGVDLGPQPLQADAENPDGHGEDKVVVTLQRQLLQRLCHGRSGRPDWGWVEGEDNLQPPSVDDAWRTQAKAYLERRRNSNQFWGWKDPRSTLLLEHWLAQDPGLKVIGIYGYPWEILDALQQLQTPLFLKHPGWGLAIWCQYNQALLQFASNHPERCILINSAALLNSPSDLLAILHQRWSWPAVAYPQSSIEALQSLIRPDRQRVIPDDDPLIQLHRACSPKAIGLLDALDAHADLPSPLASKPAATNPTPPVSSKPATPRTAELAVVITSHNQGDLLLEAVASVKRQDPNAITEFLIVDDGSTDPRTLQVITALRQQGFRVLNQRHQGVPAARNAGLAATTAPVLLFLDNDNRLLAPYLTLGLEMLRRHPSIDAVYGNRQDFGLSTRLHRVGPVNATALWQMNRIDNCALIRRSLLERCGGYDPALPALEDWDLWLSALSHPQGLHLGYIDQTCFEYRVRPDSMLQQLFQKQDQQQKVMNRLRERHGTRVGHGGFTPTDSPGPRPGRNS